MTLQDSTSNERGPRPVDVPGNLIQISAARIL